MEPKKIKTRVMFPVGLKLGIIISVLLLVSLGTVITLVSVLSTEDIRRTAEYNNFTINRRAGSHAEAYFMSIQSAVTFYLNLTDRFSVERDGEIERDFFDHNRNIAAIGISQAGRPSFFIPNEVFLLSNDLNEDIVENYFDSFLSAVTPHPGRMIFLNASPVFNRSMLGTVFVRRGRTGNEIIKVLFSPDELSESFGTGTNTSFILTDSGDVLLHPDNQYVLEGANFSNMPIVSDMQQGGDAAGRQISFTDDSEEDFFGAYYRLTGTDTTVITLIPHSVVFEAVRSLTLQNIFLAGAVMFLAIICVLLFSKTISSPIRALAAAALQIETGDFGIQLQPKGRDELKLLAESFGKMSSALTIFGRFTNKEIAVRAMRGEIKPGGLPKHATVFFSDIRSFTEKSEKFTNVFGEDASNRIVLWLNEYFTQMVRCVETTNGAVDKFIGDAVMAHWGAAFSDGSPAADAFNGVNAALMMRNALLELNKTRKKDDPGNPDIHIGCGLNTGMVTAGQIGSDERMEYTVIGDPVNLASRVEALNKPLGTDILIAEDTWDLVGDKFITEEMPSVTVKGKEKPVRVFAVINRKGAPGPQTLAEVRKLLDIETPDISKVDTDAEENKFKIQND